MPFEIIRADITKLEVDAIINAANQSLLGGGGVDGAIHAAAGPALLEACKLLNGCETGHSKITKGYNLPAKFVIHTVGPVWRGGSNDEEALLRSCYKSALNVALENNLESIAFPLISAGVYGYPKDKAIQVAVSEISAFLMHHDLLVYLVVFNKDAFLLSGKIFTAIKTFIDDHFVDSLEFKYKRVANVKSSHSCARDSSKEHAQDLVDLEDMEYEVFESPYRRLDDVLAELQETFSEHLLRLIDLKGKSDVETYKKANIDRKLFSKIRSDKYYKPSKSTAIAFSIALELSLDETKDLLQKAGYALSRSSKFDLIIEYFINEEKYNIHEINEALFAFDQSLLGA